MTPLARFSRVTAPLFTRAVVMALTLLLLPFGTAEAQPPVAVLASESVRLFAWPETVRALAPDARGFIYVGTSSGLFRFDGVTYLRLAERALAEDVASLAVDAANDVWVGTASGSVFKYADGVAQRMWQVGSRVSQLVLDPDQKLWLVAGGKLWQATNSGVTAAEGELGGLSVLSVERADNHLWVATNAGLRWCTFTPPHRCQLAASAVRPETVSSAFDNQVFVFGPSGGAFAKLGTAHAVTEEVSEGLAPPVTGSFPLGKGTLIGDREGLAYTDGEHITRYRLPGIPVGSSVSALTMVADGDIWSAVDGQGLVALRLEPEIKVLGPHHDQRPKPAFSLLFDRQGRLWQNSGRALWHWEAGSWVVHTPAPDLEANSMRGLSQGPDGDLWVASLDGGGLRFRNNTFSRVPFSEGPPLPRTNAVFHDSQAQLWLSSKDGLYVKPPHPAALPSTAPTACPGAAAAMEQTTDGFWIATDHGLCHRQGKSERAFTTKHGLPSNGLLSLLLQANGDLWIGTKDAGLVLMQGERFTTFQSAMGLRLTDVTAIVDDDHQGLWLGTSSGLVKANKADLLSVAQNRRATVRFLKLGARDGMRSENLMGWFPPASAKGKDGALYFPSHAGVVAVPSPTAVHSPEPPPVYVDDVLINGSHQRPIHDDIHIAEGNTLEVRYTAPRLRHAHRIRLQHFLEGIDRQWQEDSNPQIKYFGLPSGHFVLRLASSATDTDERAERRLRITVHPPFFRTPWFLLLSAATAIVAVAVAYRLRVWTMQRRYAAITNERTRIARDMHDTLEQNLVALKLRLEATQRFAKDQMAVEQHAGAALGLVDQAMRDARSSIWSLRAGVSEDVDLATQLSVCAGRSLKGTEITFRLSCVGAPYRLQTEAEQQLVRIVQEALTNVIKHAAAKAVELVLDFRSDGIHVSLHDDGTGLQANTAPGAAQGHFGIQGMRERIANLGGTLDITGKPNEGTELSFLIPSTWRRT